MNLEPNLYNQRFVKPIRSHFSCLSYLTDSYLMSKKMPQLLFEKNIFYLFKLGQSFWTRETCRSDMTGAKNWFKKMLITNFLNYKKLTHK